MPKQSYTKTLETIWNRLDGLTTITPEVGGAILARLDALDAKQEVFTEQQRETNDLLRTMNGRVRENSQALAAHGQYVADHNKAHEVLDGRIDYVSRKTNIATVVSSGVAAAATFFGLTRGQ